MREINEIPIKLEDMSLFSGIQTSLTLTDKNDQHSYNVQNLNSLTYFLPYFTFSVIIYLINVMFS